VDPPEPTPRRFLIFLTQITFTTAAFDRSSSWLFEAFPYRTAPKDLPSSLVQHNALRVFLTQPFPPPALPGFVGVGSEASAHARLLRVDIDEPDEQRGAISGGVWGEKSGGPRRTSFSPTLARHCAGKSSAPVRVATLLVTHPLPHRTVRAAFPPMAPTDQRLVVPTATLSVRPTRPWESSCSIAQGH
jgi:hypothetical protein